MILDPSAVTEAKARDFAILAHGAQRYGNQPYVVHLAAVRSILADFHFDQDYLIAAWLHDTIEDAGAQLATIGSKFGDRVGDLVWAVTGIGKNRRERVADAYRKLSQLPAAIPLKLADRIANVESAKATKPSLFSMYRDEQAGFRAALFPLSEAEYPAMWERLERALTK